MAASKKEDWMQSKWRPAMGWLYMITCAFDFVVFPVLWSLLQAFMSLSVTQWNPLTLQGAGLYHLAMGAVLGVAAWSRGQEKIAGMNGGSSNGSPPSGGFGGSNMGQGNGSNSNPIPSGWNQPNNVPSAQSNPNNSWSTIANRFDPPQSMTTYNAPTPESLPPPPIKQGVRLSQNPTARVVLPDDSNNDADSKIK